MKKRQIGARMGAESEADLGKRELATWGRLVFEKGEIPKVRASIDLPPRDAGHLNVEFEWSSDHHGPPPRGPGEFVAQGESYRVRISQVHVHETTSNPFFPEEGVVASATAFELEQRHYSKAKEGKETHFALVVTPNAMLNPWAMKEVSFKGTVKPIRRAKLVRVRVPGLGAVAFDHQYDWDNTEDQRIRQSRRYLVGLVKAEVPADDKARIREEVLKPFEDLLLLCGFASRTPTRCAGWLASASNGHSDYYRRDMRLPAGEQRYRTRPNDGLVALSDYSRFLNKTIGRFQKSPVQRELRRAFFALEGAAEETIEGKFSSLFAAFEGLVDGLTRDMANKRFAKDSSRRKAAQDELLALLEEKVARRQIPAEVRNQLASKIKGVQSVSMAERIRLLHKAVNLESADLWPIVASGKTPSLYVIRNWLAHGAAIEQRHIDVIDDANHHLEWLLERLMCAVLRWPLDDTDVAPPDLAGDWTADLLDWKAAAARFRSGDP